MIWNILAGIFMGTLTGMGIGGGGLLVLYLTEVCEVGQLAAQGCNLLFFVFSSAASLYIHSRRRNLDYGMIGIAALLAVVGAQMGVRLTTVISEESVRHLYGWMLVIAGTVAGLRVLRGK